jgi:hypothetical protein
MRNPPLAARRRFHHLIGGRVIQAVPLLGSQVVVAASLRCGAARGGSGSGWSSCAISAARAEKARVEVGDCVGGDVEESQTVAAGPWPSTQLADSRAALPSDSAQGRRPVSRVASGGKGIPGGLSWNQTVAGPDFAAVRKTKWLRLAPCLEGALQFSSPCPHPDEVSAGAALTIPGRFQVSPTF